MIVRPVKTMNSTRVPNSAARHQAAAFTVVEAVCCVIIVAVMLVAAMNAIAASAKARSIQRRQALSSALGKQLLGEIMQSRYQDPNQTTVLLGPELGETTRSQYNDVDDYNGWIESPPQDRNGKALPGLAGWTRSVAVAWVTPANPANTSALESGLKRITVTVTSPTGQVSQETALRSQYSPYDQTVGSQINFVSWVGMNIQVGADQAGQVVLGTNTNNQAP